MVLIVLGRRGRQREMRPGGLLLACIDPVGYATGNAYVHRGNRIKPVSGFLLNVSYPFRHSCEGRNPVQNKQSLVHFEVCYF